MTTPIPQPEGSFLIGNASEIDPNFTLGSFQRLQKLYGDIYRLTILGRKVVIVSSQEIVNFVCDESKFDKKVAEPVKELRNAGGDGLFTAHTSEPNWKLAHKILMPAFGPQAIRDMFPSMMDICSQLILRWERFSGEEIDVSDNLTRLTLDTLALCSFNYRFNSFYQEKLHRFVDSMINILKESGRRIQRFSLQNTLMIRTSRQYFDDIAYLHNLCDEIVQQRRENPNDINDLLNRMIHGKDPDTGYQLSDENIRYQMITFLVAGHETTSGLLSFTLYYLLKNPQALQKARAEVDQYDEITVNTLNKLKYLDAVLKETLRLQPTAPLFALQSKEETIVLPGGYEVGHDDSILVLLHELHRDPKIWDRPEEFLPERMLDGGYENLPPNAWKPFGNGQRGCIGRPFAWQESLLSIALILKHFHMEFVDPSYDLRLKQTLTIKPVDFKIRVRSRQRVSIPLEITTNKQGEKIPEQTTAQSNKNNNLQPMSILFGSNSGSCESFAETLASEAPLHGFNATVATLDSAVSSLPNDRPVIIITASYEGKPCENAKQFVAYLGSKPKLNITYAVFGAGHHDWVTTYQKIPIYIDEMLAQAGGTRIIERGAGDAAGDFFGAFEAWKENLFQTLNKTTGIKTIIGEEKLTIEIVNSTRNLGQITDVGIIRENKILVKANNINPMIRHIEIELPKGQTYRSGDYLAILPTNPIQVVHRVLQRFNLSTDTHIKIHSTTDTFFPTGHPVSAVHIISGYVELSQLISKKQIETLASLCKDENEQTKLANLANDLYQTEILDKRKSILDILGMYPSCDLSFSHYLRMLPSLRIRQYSISSSPLWNSECATITFDIIDGPALSGHGQYYGVASNYLSNLKTNDRISCTVRASNAGFHLPADTKVPVIMIATGTGIAPFRGFIQERTAQLVCGREVGSTILYYGCRTENDFLYANEFDRWSKFDAIQIKTTFSRQSDENKKYVQHLMWEDRLEIARLYRQGARFYTCGSATKLAASVKTCFIKIIADDQQCDEAKAAKILENISIDRYNVDVFA
jgi:cytochrome P450/NADPH-cytochrome P450 reductase